MIAPCRRVFLPRAAVAGVVVFVLSGPARADEPRVKPASKDRQHIAGVIIKAEPIKNERGKSAARRVALTINTAAVWRDWVRDQAAEAPGQSARKDAKQGAESVATKGEPANKNTLVTVEVADESQVETRFRAPDDETSRGESAANRKSGSKDKARRAAKPTQFRVADLKPGLFIETDFARKDDRNVASTLAVVRPLPASDASK